MANNLTFSIILPTYTGGSTIDQTFQSLFMQEYQGLSFEIIVVIDGPGEKFRQYIESQKLEFEGKGINFKIEQFQKNKGRFEARKTGANLAKTSQLFFIDDRIYLEDNYFSILKNINEKLLLANVIEVYGDSNLMSNSLFYIRKSLYGKKWGKNFAPYYIDKSNFETAPKGTASLWVNKNLFLDVCEEISKNTRGNNKYVNEDTRILRAIVDRGEKIYRTSKLKIYYLPRVGFKESAHHLYNRGPRFVDYYIRPGTRFFPLLLFIYLTYLSALVLLILKPGYFKYLIAGLIILILFFAVIMGRTPKAIYTLVLGLPLILIFFTAGIIKGTILNINNHLIGNSHG